MPIDNGFEDLLGEISSKSPAPGGGSVAALSGCLGASLVSMVCNLSIGKKSLNKVEDEMKEVLGESDAIRRDLLNLSRMDAEAFNEVIAALKMTGEKKNKVLQNAYKKAADIPFTVAKKCLRIIELVQVTIYKGNQNAITDSGVGALLAHSGLKGAVLNVKVNLKYIDDEDFVAKKAKELEIMEERGENLLNLIMSRIESLVTRSEGTS